MYKRIIAIYCVLILLMTGAIYRIYFIDASDYITMAASVQGKYKLSVATTRGTIYDRDMKRLVNDEYRYVAAVLPTPEAAAALLPVTADDDQPALMERLTDARPFALGVSSNNLYAQGLDLFRVPKRYGDIQYAPHLVGYLSDGIGAAGLERAYDANLTTSGGEIGVLYQMDAAGRAMEQGAVAVERTNEEALGGIVLTLDKSIQLFTQEALAAGCNKGAAVVMDVHTGDILAMASLPSYDQNDILASLDRDDAPFINRAISGYNIGSVFKLIVASAALEDDVSQYFEHDCQGYTDIDGQIFRCNNSAVHGICDMERALKVSCNSYFIALAKELRPELLLSMAENMGLSQGSTLAPSIVTQAGNLPGAAELQTPAVYANFSFGQGSSLASPLQMAGAVAAIANSGMAVTPRLVKGFTPDGYTLTDPVPTYTSNQVLSERTSAIMRGLMVGVVEDGSGKPARPLFGSAGGKTSSAQTGQMVDDKEIVHAWFAGFYPAQKPRYSIVVFVEGGESGEHVAAPIFKQICDDIGTIKNSAQ